MAAPALDQQLGQSPEGEPRARLRVPGPDEVRTGADAKLDDVRRNSRVNAPTPRRSRTTAPSRPLASAV